MNKNQLTMAIIGGVAAVIVLGVAYLIYDQSSERDTALEELQQQQAIFEQNKNASEAEAKDIQANTAELKQWTVDATDGASALTNALRYTETMRGSSFKTQMMDDVRRFASLPEDATTKFFAFDGRGAVFPDLKDYVAGSSTPSEAELPKVQRRWGDITLVIDTLLESGVTALESVTVVEPPAPEPTTKAKGKQPAPVNPIASETYVFTYSARPAALVNVLNALAKTELFVSVDELSFVQEPDPIVTKFTEATAKKTEGGSRRRARANNAWGAPADKADKGEQEAQEVRTVKKVTDPSDPLICTPFKVVMKVSTHVVKAQQGKEARK